MTTQNAAAGTAQPNAGAAAPSPSAPSTSAPATVSTTPAAKPAAATPSGNTDSGSSSDRKAWITPEVQKAMDFDPFTPASEELNPTATKPADGTSPSGDGSQSAQPPSVTPAQPAAVTPAAVPPPVPDELGRLREENTRLLNAVLSGQKPQGQSASGQQPNDETDPTKAIPAYDFNLHDQLITQMNSEDPVERKAAIGHLIKGVAQGIHATVLQTVMQQINNLRQSLPQQMTTQLQMQQQSSHVETDFYSKYPQLKTPELRMVVKGVAEQLLASGKYPSWSPELRDEIGKQVYARISAAIPQNPTAPAAAPQPAMFGGNTAQGNVRVQTNSANKSQMDHMADIF